MEAYKTLEWLFCWQAWRAANCYRITFLISAVERPLPTSRIIYGWNSAMVLLNIEGVAYKETTQHKLGRIRLFNHNPWLFGVNNVAVLNGMSLSAISYLGGCPSCSICCRRIATWAAPFDYPLSFDSNVDIKSRFIRVKHEAIVVEFHIKVRWRQFQPWTRQPGLVNIFIGFV